ncbi:MAG: FeoA domain-containing protein [Elusimicrobiales bacterium]|jgi:ferrous iron transport protein A|nr:FeoA domain-containing protein [Elusimicrobiales bacterium]NLH39005.1 ferrous iron transport protein A [Elusimicrobiota bacterium]
MEITLSKAKNAKLKVIKINGGRNMIAKLYSMGIYEGVDIEKLVSYSKGPVVIKVLNSQIAIGHNMAEKIVVKEMN